MPHQKKFNISLTVHERKAVREVGLHSICTDIRLKNNYLITNQLQMVEMLYSYYNIITYGFRKKTSFALTKQYR